MISHPVQIAFHMAISEQSRPHEVVVEDVRVYEVGEFKQPDVMQQVRRTLYALECEPFPFPLAPQGFEIGGDKFTKLAGVYGKAISLCSISMKSYMWLRTTKRRVLSAACTCFQTTTPGGYGGASGDDSCKSVDNCGYRRRFVPGVSRRLQDQIKRKRSHPAPSALFMSGRLCGNVARASLLGARDGARTHDPLLRKIRLRDSHLAEL
jgi:hypothetical protein